MTATNWWKPFSTARSSSDKLLFISASTSKTVSFRGPLGPWESPGTMFISALQTGGLYQEIATSASPPRNDSSFGTFSQTNSPINKNIPFQTEKPCGVPQGFVAQLSTFCRVSLSFCTRPSAKGLSSPLSAAKATIPVSTVPKAISMVSRPLPACSRSI